MNETAAILQPKARVFKGLEGLSRLKDQQPSSGESIPKGQKDSRESTKASSPKAIHTLKAETGYIHGQLQQV